MSPSVWYSLWHYYLLSILNNMTRVASGQEKYIQKMKKRPVFCKIEVCLLDSFYIIRNIFFKKILVVPSFFSVFFPDHSLHWWVITLSHHITCALKFAYMFSTYLSFMTEHFQNTAFAYHIMISIDNIIIAVLLHLQLNFYDYFKGLTNYRYISFNFSF